MKVIVLSSQQCENKGKNNGDCFIVDNGKELVVYDCGSEDYAKYVMEYMQENGYVTTKIVLSHNDADHFDGIPTLVENGKVSQITTVLLLKHLEDLLDIIDDGRKKRNSLREQVKREYSNIASLSGCNLQDALEFKEIAEGIKVIGPSKDYILNAAAKGLDTTEGDTIDGDTITNATSIHVSVDISGKKMLLTGDSTQESVFEENLNEYAVIQLPHHGKKETGEAIMGKLKNVVEEVYVVSDNTGDSNGGSDDLETTGYDVRNTKENGMLMLDYMSISRSKDIKGTLYEIYNTKTKC